MHRGVLVADSEEKNLQVFTLYAYKELRTPGIRRYCCRSFGWIGVSFYYLTQRLKASENNYNSMTRCCYLTALIHV